MTERGRVRFGNTTIEYDLRRSERRKKTVPDHCGRGRSAGRCAIGDPGQ